MNRRTDNERLLAEVLADESGAGFREALLHEALRHVRIRRQWRRARRIGGGVALVIGIGIAIWPGAAPRVTRQKITGPTVAPYQLVISRPLLPSQIVATTPGTMGQVIPSEMMPGRVHTLRGGYREVGDDELLALAAPQIAALVRRGPHAAELVFLPPPATAVQPN